mgnify:CR=1 FL=1
MGANGSGKSTFFSLLQRNFTTTKGRYLFHGKPVSYKRKELLALRAKVGIVFQDPDKQLFSASVEQEISFGILNLGVAKEQARTEVEQVMEELEIVPFRKRPVHALSGGQKKQVSIADILVMKPEIIILDEPAAALDPRHTALVNRIVDQLTQEGITVLLSTHDVDYAMAWADDVILLKDGKVLTQGTPQQVFSDKTALAATNLKAPACLELFDSLCRKGILKMSLPVPRTLAQLETYISCLTQHSTYYGGKTPMNNPKQAILVVSFGTSYNLTRERTIDVIEKKIQEAWPQYTIRRAWTSKMIMAKLLRRDHVKIR